MERELFHDLQFQVRYHHLTGRVTLRVTIDGQALPRLVATSRAVINGVIGNPANAKRPQRRQPPGGPGNLFPCSECPRRGKHCKGKRS